MQSDELKRRIAAGRGDTLADLVLKNARIVNVFTDEIDTADIAISGNSIVAWVRITAGKKLICTANMSARA